MKTKLKFIGIDVSKSTLDVCELSAQRENSYRIANAARDIIYFFQTQVKVDPNCHICIENTGKYGWVLMEILSRMDCHFYVVNPLHLTGSLGLVRGGNDKISALRMAQFIEKNYDRVGAYIPRRKQIESLQLLLCERTHKVKQRAQLKAKNKELMVLECRELIEKLVHQNTQLIEQLNRQIKELQTQIKNLIKEDNTLRKLQQQLQSVPGVGPVLSWNLLVKTNEFKAITDPRKMACYAGVVPFSKTSGTSVFGRNRVSIYGDKPMKKLLHLAAMSAIRLDNDLRVFYQRKLEEGKNKMSVLNAVRNKIIHIIFALVKNQTFYQNRLVTS